MRRENQTPALQCEICWYISGLSISRLSAVLFKWLGTCIMPKCAHYCFKSLSGPYMVLIFEVPHLGIFDLSKGSSEIGTMYMLPAFVGVIWFACYFLAKVVRALGFLNVLSHKDIFSFLEFWVSKCATELARLCWWIIISLRETLLQFWEASNFSSFTSPWQNLLGTCSLHGSSFTQ